MCVCSCGCVWVYMCIHVCVYSFVHVHMVTVHNCVCPPSFFLPPTPLPTPSCIQTHPLIDPPPPHKPTAPLQTSCMDSPGPHVGSWDPSVTTAATNKATQRADALQQRLLLHYGQQHVLPLGLGEHVSDACTWGWEWLGCTGGQGGGEVVSFCFLLCV